MCMISIVNSDRMVNYDEHMIDIANYDVNCGGVSAWMSRWGN